jgi:hypothetical protein
MGIICVEYRTENSRRVHFNKEGDWRPRMIVWPEYEGSVKDDLRPELDPDDGMDDQWGLIVAGAISEFAQARRLVVVAYERRQPSLWEWLVSSEAPPRFGQNRSIFDAEYVNGCQHQGHQQTTFLLVQTGALDGLPREIRAPVLDRTNLLPLGSAIFELGIEEAVIEVALPDEAEPAPFLGALEAVSERYNHKMERVTKHFLSH